MDIRTDLYLGDSNKILKNLPDNSIDLIVTSPPTLINVKELTAAFIITNMLNGFFQ